MVRSYDDPVSKAIAEIQWLRQAVDDVLREKVDLLENAPPKQMKRIELLVNRLEDVLLDCSDTDPRH